MLTMGTAPLLTLLPLLHRSVSQHLYSHVLSFAALHACKKTVLAVSQTALGEQIFVNVFVHT